MDNGNELLNPIIYLDLPIDSPSKDVIGFNSYVERLSAAIDGGAQSIAITSDYGMGKSSIIELLKEKRSNNKNEEIIEVPMWSQLQEDANANDLHKSFVFQIANQISPVRGTYVSRRLNSNYEILKIHTNKPFGWFLIILSALFFVLAFVIEHFYEQIRLIIPFMSKISNISPILFVISLVLIIIAISFSEILYSIGREGKERHIEPGEITEIYYSEILKYRLFHNRFFKYNVKKHYIVVIEDLDRSDKKDVIKNFLKEFRKYYIPSENESRKRFRNKITFIVNIKPESILDLSDRSQNRKDEEEKNYKEENIYDKVFDYILNVQKINIDDYEVILSGLLEEQKEKINDLGLIISNGSLTKIPGMQWIIREPLSGIRQVKERLNRAFSLYASLSERFSVAETSFEKCAAVAYVTTAFEKDFYKTNDTFFDKLVIERIKKGRIDGAVFENKDSFCAEYIDAIAELINAGLIDDNYRMYFYNYPRNSKALTYDEELVKRAILYNEALHAEDLNNSVLRLQKTESSIIADSLNKLDELGIVVNDVVFGTENLYLAVLKINYNYIYNAMKRWNYEAESAGKSIDKIVNVLAFDPDRRVYNSDVAKRFAALWNSKFEEEQLLKLRLYLCEKHSDEIGWYKEFFRGTHALANSKELDYVPYSSALKLLDKSNENFNTNYLKYVIERYKEIPDRESFNDITKDFIAESADVIGISSVAPIALDFMMINELVFDVLEEIVVKDINAKLQQGVDVAEMIRDYKNLIVKAAPNGVSDIALNFISSSRKYDNYSVKIGEELKKEGRYFDAAMVFAFLDKKFPYSNDDVVNAVVAEKSWLTSNNKEFSMLRKSILGYQRNTIKKYSELFANDCPVINEEEFELATQRLTVDEIDIVLPPEIVTDAEVPMLVGFFNSKERSVSESFEILKYISRLNNGVVRTCFNGLLFGDYIKYKDFTNEQKTRTKQAFFEAFKLNKIEEKIRYMQTTKCLDYEFECELSAIINSNPAFKDSYIETVKMCNSGANEQTISLLTGFKGHYAFADYITDLFFEKGLYENYVISKTLYEEVFVFEEGERGELLWSTYVDIFVKNKDSVVVSYMSDNDSFILALMQEKKFVGLNPDLRMKFAKVRQSEDSIIELGQRDSSFIIEYLCKSDGFEDSAAASAFINLLEKKSDLLKSDELYDYMHEKLVSPDFKRRYTRLRNMN